MSCIALAWAYGCSNEETSTDGERPSAQERQDDEGLAGSPSPASSGGAKSMGGKSGAGGGVDYSLPGGSYNEGGRGGQGGGGAGGEEGVNQATLADALFPLTQDNSWTYVVIKDVDGECDQVYLTERIYDVDDIGGREAPVISQLCGLSSKGFDSRLTAANGQVYQWLSPRWNRILPMPLQEGYTWTIVNGPTFRWKYEGEVKVPAGTFQECWTRDHVPAVGQRQGPSNTYCPGIGRVRQASATLVLELERYAVRVSGP